MEKIIDTIDNFLNQKTMYQLVFQGLIIIAFFAIIFGFLGIISYGGISLIGSLFVLCVTCYVCNLIFAKIVSASANFESSFITALILFFIISPPIDMYGYGALVFASAVAMASKYFLVLHQKHIFNPAGIAMVTMTITGIGSVLWWVATISLFPFVLILGMLILRKIHTFRLFIIFFITAIIVIFFFTLSSGFNISKLFPELFISWPLLFFGMIMLTEPRSTPPTMKQQTIYALIVGILFGTQFEFGVVYSTPQLALIIGNIYTFIVSPKFFSKLVFKDKKKIASGIYEFVFTSEKKLNHIPGQYLEWTLPHQHMDGRGVRRYFTVASSPTEYDIKIGIRDSGQKGSSFKKHLMSLSPGDSITASGLAGDFILPKNIHKKLVFIAGGIGVTPFRSIIQYLIDTKQKRDIVLIYSNKTIADIAYKDIFDQASSLLSIKTMYVVNDPTVNTPSASGMFKTIDKEMILTHIPDYKDRLFYISGPLGMISSFEMMLHSLGILRRNIKTDFFSGY